jgi:hypothetical protein
MTSKNRRTRRETHRVPSHPAEGPETKRVRQAAAARERERARQRAHRSKTTRRVGMVFVAVVVLAIVAITTVRRFGPRPIPQAALGGAERWVRPGPDAGIKRTGRATPRVRTDVSLRDGAGDQRMARPVAVAGERARVRRTRA